jgi:hypothetical protein
LAAAARARKIRENAALGRVEEGGSVVASESFEAVDFGYLEDFAAGDLSIVREVLVLFQGQADIWVRSLNPEAPGWRDTVHTIKGAARGVGAHALGDVCAKAEEAGGEGDLAAVQAALDAALADIATYLARA